jgi:hypothetical protein
MVTYIFMEMYGNKARLRLQIEMEGINITDWSNATRLCSS